MIQIPSVAPATGLLASIAQIWALIRTKTVMQWRRWGFWLAFGIAAIILLLIFSGTASLIRDPVPFLRSQNPSYHHPVSQSDVLHYFVGFCALYTDLIMALV